MKIIEITTHLAVKWTFKEESFLRDLVKVFANDLHRLHNAAYGGIPNRDKESIRRKVYRLRMDKQYVETVNNVRLELLGV